MMIIVNITDLAELNPWWTDPSEIENIKEIRSWKETKSKIEYIPRIINKFKSEEDMIYTLRGPRQVGKTTLQFISIYRLLERKVEPRRIFYWTLDLIKDRTELQEILMTYIDWIRSQTEKRAYIFLDEITSVAKWQNVIKFLVDTNKLRNFFVLVTASHTMDLARGAERLPGRQGTADPLPNKILLPMKFIEYIGLRNNKIKSWIIETNFKALETRKEIFDDLIKGKSNNTLEELGLYGKKINDLFIDYAINGGVIKAIDTYLGEGFIPISVYNDYKEFIVGEFLKAKMNEDYLVQILTQLLETHTSPIGWETLKKQTTIRSRDTISKYVNHLQYSYIVSVIKRLKHEKNTPDYPKNKKVYFSDPFIFHAIRSWIKGIKNPLKGSFEFMKQEKSLSHLIEAIVCNHLLRWIYNYYQSPLIDPHNRLFFWRTKKDKEIDFIFNQEEKYVPIEVKYRNKITPSDLMGLLTFISTTKSFNGVVLSKNLTSFEDERYSVLPVSLFLCLI